MAEFASVLVPREIVNDDCVTLVRWLVSRGDRVRQGQALAEIETSKAVLEVEAEQDGYIELLASEGGTAWSLFGNRMSKNIFKRAMRTGR